MRYLLERFGPARFLELYRAVRPATFPADCQRVLGTPWPQLEAEFWQWLHERAALPPATHSSAAAAGGRGDDVEPAPGGAAARWSAALAAYKRWTSALPLIFAIAWPSTGLLLLAMSYAGTAVRRHPTATPPHEAPEPERRP